MELLSCKRCGLVDSFTTEKKGPHLVATCSCGAFIKNVSYDTPKIYFGKYKGREIQTLKSDEEIRYLNWLISQKGIKSGLITQITTHLKSL